MKISFLLTVLFCLLNMFLNQMSVNSVNINNNSNAEFNINLSILSLFVNTTSLCIISESEEILYDFLDLFKNDYKTVIIIEDLTMSLLTCVFVLLRNEYTVRDCGPSVLDSYQTTVVYVSRGSFTTTFSPRGLEGYLYEAETQDVFALSLSDRSLFQLSPVFPKPRHFVRTSVVEVLQRRGEMNSKKLDLHGSTLSIGALYYYPIFIHVNSNSTNSVPDQHDGVYAQLVEEMARHFNFSYTYILYLYYGSASSNGTWEEGGLGKIIQEGKVDIISTSVWQTVEYYDIMDFGPAINKAKMCFMVMRPEVIDFQWQAILHIFKPRVWFAIIGSFVVTVLMYWAGVNWGHRPSSENWSGCILTVFGYFTSSTSHRVDESSARFSLTSWSVFSLVITTFLSTGIVTRLTVPSYSPRIDSVQQLVEGDFFWSAQFYADYENNTMLKESFFNFKNHWIERFERRHVLIDHLEINITAETDKKMAYVVQVYGNDYVFLETDGLDGIEALKNFRVSKEVLTEAHVSFGVKKQSILLEPLTDFTLLLLQAGLVTRWMDDVNRRWPEFDYGHMLIEQDYPTFSEPRGLPLFKVQPVFLLLLFGLGLAFFVFLMEVYIGGHQLLVGIMSYANLLD